MSGFVEGAIYAYNCLWARESRRGEESGLKQRPVRLVLKSGIDPERLCLFAITTQPPQARSFAIEGSNVGRQKGGATQRCWIGFDEYNVARADRTCDFGRLEPVGRFNRDFLQSLAAVLRSEGPKRRLAAVVRT